MQKFQLERGDGNSVMVQNMNGVSAGQLINNLGILTNGQEPSGAAQAYGVVSGVKNLVGGAGMLAVEQVTETSTRNSEIVAHADTILDLALVDYKGQD